MNTRILTAGLSVLLLMASSNSWGDDSAKKTDDAQNKKHCDDMMKGRDMSKMSPAEHEAMMKRCREMKEQEGVNKKPNE